MRSFHRPTVLAVAMLTLGLASCGGGSGGGASYPVVALPPVATTPPPTTPAPVTPPVPATINVKLIAFNDLHGNLEPPKVSIAAPAASGGTVAVPAGGAAYMASAIAALKARNPNNAVVSAGDMIGASPMVSALFLDEPTIEAVNLMKIDFNAKQQLLLPQSQTHPKQSHVKIFRFADEVFPQKAWQPQQNSNPFSPHIIEIVDTDVTKAQILPELGMTVLLKTRCRF